MLPGDGPAEAARAAAGMEDVGARHFYDPHRAAGDAVARSIGGREWADPARCHRGEELRPGLTKAAAAVLAQ